MTDITAESLAETIAVAERAMKGPVCHLCGYTHTPGAPCWEHEISDEFIARAADTAHGLAALARECLRLRGMLGEACDRARNYGENVSGCEGVYFDNDKDLDRIAAIRSEAGI